jgi:hypothetical protein
MLADKNNPFEGREGNSGKESSVNEVFPVVAGVLSALLVWQYVAVRIRALALGACGMIFGAIAAFISGELFVSWVFVVIDAAVVLLSAAATAASITWWQWHSRQAR